MTLVNYSNAPATEADVTPCDHAAVLPDFDPKQAETLPARAIRERWPRFHGRCPTCGEEVIAYHSFLHYLYGGW